MTPPTYEEIAALVEYASDSGDLRWTVDSRVGFKGSALMHSAGGAAGCKRSDGRFVIRLVGRVFLAHRVAWLLHTKEWPNGEIDHINGDPSDNRMANLRVVTRGVNQQNIRSALSGKKTSQLLGVYLDKRKSKKKWRSAITLNGKQTSLGYYLTEEEAHAAYVGAKRALHVGCTI